MSEHDPHEPQPSEARSEQLFDDVEFASDEVDEELDYAERRRIARTAFSPSQPIRTVQLFLGRSSQLQRLLDLIDERGRHALVYGERGVGKTSLARVVETFSVSRDRLAIYETLDSSDTFDSVWHRVFRALTMQVRTAKGVGFLPKEESQAVGFDQLLPRDAPCTPHDVLLVLDQLGQAAGQEVVVFLDEFDRPTDLPSRVAYADLVKLLADRGSPVTIVMVGVARAVNDLIREHESISRHLAQIEMPLMARTEIAEIIQRGLVQAHLEVEPEFVTGVVEIAQGLPHYAHLIGQHAALRAVDEDLTVVRGVDFAPVVRAALGDASQTVRETYLRAITSTRDTLHRHVLTACAAAEKDELGFFGSAQVRDQLNRIKTDKTYDIPHFAGHLNEFSGQDGHRGRILTKTQGAGHFRYRFNDPLIPPYVLMQAHADGLIET